MSSAEEDSLMASKKRKLQRACDYCRRKKSMCHTTIEAVRSSSIHRQMCVHCTSTGGWLATEFFVQVMVPRCQTIAAPIV